MRHARQITLVLQDRDSDAPAELDLDTMQELLAQKPLISHTDAGGRLLIYSLDRHHESARKIVLRSAANDHQPKK
ncbi:MAG TPA: hypothetical protein VHA10_25000 [Hypericibacter adhaerens]|jgi:hypothetical protein|uniref:hypothetical protein n=1 Tax=Hypericibacter adhaerens TaxID=2602016 RepID=UPI002D06FC75|nr:hypothetical protein [Hypericibacter adhaerens]HWA46500.1 hypothetical protein [Hypericibacter adhaerens]